MNSSEILSYRSNGKLLISGEYFVLDGALALAVPSRYGQRMNVAEGKDSLSWSSYTVNKDLWFEAKFDYDFNVIESSNLEIATTLKNMLVVASYLNDNFKEKAKNKNVELFLEFPQDWGLGSSSTLINNIAQWAGVDPFMLQQESFPGSGYDIACAFNNVPIIYSILNKEVTYTSTSFYPPFYKNIFFVHLNKKQSSREAIEAYRKKNFEGDLIDEVSEYSHKFSSCKDVDEFKRLIAQHEKLVSSVIGIKTVKEDLFPDFYGSIKSLGAWGGDFVMAVGDNVESYFSKKGYTTIIPFENMVL